ncbi:cell death-inducing p53-target protein 1-like isoform X2 [Centruroides sculpturatus]|uniref:cell death-inducing p53-target protein 1-like isoform X2 n=1 Tax=Centruroides sculpturatus TaxID=218467 RepID=UPI000C6DF2B5|nr:cell death-inducing p53-target protein 1-like isoform X2 [Centruroides sculpturatus]
MDQQKPPAGTTYPEPPPPYTSGPAPPPNAYHQPPGPYGGMAFFPGPSHHPPPPGGVPVFPMAGYQPQPPTSTMVVGSPATTPVTSVTVVNVAQWGPYPTQITCPHCGVQVLTETTARIGLLTLLLSGALVFLGCWLGCCLIPCCIPECQDIDHRCPNCKAQLGTFTRL